MTMTIDGTAAPLAIRERDPADLAPRFVISLDELRQQLRDLEEFKRDIMVSDVDYGVIPGTPKPTLLKPGAEKLAMVFGLVPLFTVSNRIEDWERGFFHYEVTCDLYSKRSGERVANGIGSANSKEPRYRWRDAKPICPNCGRELRRSRNRDGEQGESGWYCWAKVGGCGANYPAAQIGGPVGRVENPEPYELVNTLVKMGEKRSLVAAVLIATGGSGIWTQDVEDLPSAASETVIEGRAVEVPPASAAQQGRGAGPPSAPRRPNNIRQATAERMKPTETPCGVDGCGRMVESQALLKEGQANFGGAYCVAHINELLDGLKDEKAVTEEAPF